MTQSQKLSSFFLRLTLGWMFFYAGITKVMDSNWSSVGYLKGAKNFQWFYGWLSSPSIIPVVDFINEWGLTLLGISLILGVSIKLSSRLGALLMLLYYLPILDFPYPNAHAFIVDEHIIYIAALFLLSSINAGESLSLQNWLSNKIPSLRKFFS